MILILLGPPGSGKGTQAKLLTSEHHWPQLSTGDMLRSAIAKGTKVGLEAKAFMDQGKLVPDEVVIKLIEERIKETDCQQGFILDGFPRTIAQAQALDSLLDTQKKAVTKAILFNIPDTQLVRRLSGRRTCDKCTAMYHVELNMPKKAGICDKCGASLVQRNDDQPDVIQNRLAVYHKQTAPLAEFYQNQSKLKNIDATLPPQEVSKTLSELLQ